MTPKQINSLRRKIVYHRERQWGGYLTTMERLYILTTLGIAGMLDEHQEAERMRCIEDRSRGRMSSTWFYFEQHPSICHILPKPMHTDPK